MKINGTKIYKPASSILVFPRNGTEDIRLEIVAVLERTEFDKLCPTPSAPLMLKRGGEKVANFEDKGFLASVQYQSELYTKWICLKSIKAASNLPDTPPTDIEWETVDINDPKTWDNYQQELIDSGFSDMERARIQNAVFEVNSLNESKVREARDSFLLWRQSQLLESTSPMDEQLVTKSGEPVSVLG